VVDGPQSIPDKVGGYCWITAANKTSKLQTEIGSFHVWWGPEYAMDEKQRCGGWPKNWEMWPKKPQILEHFQTAAEEFGLLPYIHFGKNVAKLETIGERKDQSHYYGLLVQNLVDDTQEEVKASVIYNYPGSMTKNRIGLDTHNLNNVHLTCPKPKASSHRALLAWFAGTRDSFADTPGSE